MQERPWNVNELRAIDAAMAEFEQRCRSLLALIGDKPRLTNGERDLAREQYTALKADLREAYKRGTLTDRLPRPLQSRAESAFYHPAVHKAMVALRPATNTNPVTSRWFSAIHAAESEFSYYRYQLEKLIADQPSARPPATPTGSS